MRPMLLAFALLSLPGCASKRPIVATPPVKCATLIPDTWAAGVDATPIPDNAPVTLGTLLTAPVEASIIAPWASAYVGMSGQLEKANGRTSDAISIMAKCEALVNAARNPKD